MTDNHWANPTFRQCLRLQAAARLMAADKDFQDLSGHPAALEFCVRDAVRAADALMKHIEEHPVE